jgi:hypothetical protein
MPHAKCVFEHTLKMSPQLSKNYIFNRVTGRLLGLHIDLYLLGVNS